MSISCCVISGCKDTIKRPHGKILFCHVSESVYLCSRFHRKSRSVISPCEWEPRKLPLMSARGYNGSRLCVDFILPLFTGYFRQPPFEEVVYGTTLLLLMLNGVRKSKRSCARHVQREYRMKKGFTICSVIAAVLLCWAFLFKLVHWPGGTVMSFAAFVISIVAIIWGACEYTKLGKLGKGVVIYNVITFVLTFLGLWLIIAHWPGGHVMCMLCLGILLPVAIICTAVSYTKRNK